MAAHSNRALAFRSPAPADLAVRAPITDAYAEILSPDALDFLAQCHAAFDGPRRELLRSRASTQRELDDGGLPDFPQDSGRIRAAEWSVAGLDRREREDRRVAITTPPDRKALITALNSGASECVADFDLGTSPTWSNLAEGQVNLRDAVAGTITYTSTGGMLYRLHDETAGLALRPRPWALDERRVMVGGQPVSAGLFDLGLFLFHNAARLLQLGRTPHVLIPNLENRFEARWWSDVLAHAEDQLELPRGAIRATVVIGHVLAAFEMEEMLWELRERATGLAWSRADYLHSFVRTFRNRPEFVLPERRELSLERHFLRAATDLLVRTAHRRGVHALTGVVTQLPIKEHSAAHRRAMHQLRAETSRDVQVGFDGACVGHPELVPVLREVFDLRIKQPNQLSRQRDDVAVTAQDLLAVPACVITHEGLRETVRVALVLLEAWLRGTGRVAVDHQLEDAATAELAGAQLWQWVKYGARLDDGRRIGSGMLEELIALELAEESEQHGSTHFESSRFLNAADLLVELVRSHEMPEGLCAAARPYLR